MGRRGQLDQDSVRWWPWARCRGGGGELAGGKRQVGTPVTEAQRISRWRWLVGDILEWLRDQVKPCVPGCMFGLYPKSVRSEEKP